ncbi:MAG TPA: ArsR family transcriptional regulator [Anaerolineales bacterium]|nr:ArsR family transcriptional regulator [Anaerolineales bacterium]
MSTSTRDTILRTLRAHRKCTITDLAEAAGVSPVSVRHHLANLQAEGLIQADEVRHGVGRPRLEFSLSEAGLDQFPSRYFRLTKRLLDELKARMPEAEVGEVFSGVAQAMAETYAAQLAGLPLPQQLERLTALLREEGFDADVQIEGDRVFIRELSCPYFRMGRQHPEICMIDQSFIATALSLPVEKVTCLLDGDVNCTFTVAVDGAAEGAALHE